jgi:hypothetical protein
LLCSWCRVRTTAGNTPTSGHGSAGIKWKNPDVGGRQMQRRRSSISPTK